MLRFKWETDFQETENGEIPKDWQNRELGSIVKRLSKGKPPNAELRGHGEYPYLSVEYLRGEAEAEFLFPREEGTLVNDDDVLIIWDGAANAGEILRGRKGLLGSTQVRLELNDECDSGFLYAALKLAEEHLRSLRSGTDDRHVDKDGLLQVPVPLPSKMEQSRISRVLSLFETLTENKRKQNQILKETARAIFGYWFVDLEPFKGEEFVDSEFGPIPRGWEVRPIAEVAKLENGFSYAGKEKFSEPVEGSFVFITLNNFVEGGGFKPEYSWVRSDRLTERHFLKEEDLVLANTHFGVGGSDTGRLLATPAIVSFPVGYGERRGVFSHHLTKISPRDANRKLFLYLFLEMSREDSVTFATGTGVMGLDLDNFRQNKLILCPPVGVLEKINTLLEPLFMTIVRNQKAILALKNAHDTLLPLLVLGKLRVEAM